MGLLQSVISSSSNDTVSVFLNGGQRLTGSILGMDYRSLMIDSMHGQVVVMLPSIATIVDEHGLSSQSQERAPMLMPFLRECKDSRDPIDIWLLTGVRLQSNNIIALDDNGMLVETSKDMMFVSFENISSIAKSQVLQATKSEPRFVAEEKTDILNYLLQICQAQGARIPVEIFLINGVRITGYIDNYDESVVKVKNQGKVSATLVMRRNLATMKISI